MSSVRVAILASHPVQYQAPWFAALAAAPGLDVEVLFGMLPTAEQQGAGFGHAFAWDVPLTEGYPYRVLDNVAAQPSLRDPEGIVTPTVGRVLRELDPHVVLATGWQNRGLRQGIQAAHRQRRRLVLRAESSDLAPRRLAWHLLMRLYLRRFHAVLPIGSANRRFYRRHGVAPDRLFDAPYFVPTAHLPPCESWPDLRQVARRRWGIAADACVVVFVGKVEAKKRPLDLVAALALGVRPLHLLVVGTGPLEGDVREAVVTAGVPATFAGFLNQAEIGAAYAAADVLVLPSDHGETWGLVVNEAMAMGLCVVVSDQVGCAEDLCVPGRTGWRYPCGNVAALAACLAEVAADPARARAWGRQAREHVKAWSLEAAVAGTLAAIDHLCGESRT